MATLHLVNRANALPACLAVMGRDDALLLIEDAVYVAVAGRAPNRDVFALESDVRARGLQERLGPRVRIASDAEFVSLVEHHQPVVTWR